MKLVNKSLREVLTKYSATIFYLFPKAQQVTAICGDYLHYAMRMRGLAAAVDSRGHATVSWTLFTTAQYSFLS